MPIGALAASAILKGAIHDTIFGTPPLSESSQDVEVCQFRVFIREISPAIWRRFLIRSDHTIADLHYALHIIVGWDDAHLNRFITLHAAKNTGLRTSSVTRLLMIQKRCGSPIFVFSALSRVYVCHNPDIECSHEFLSFAMCPYISHFGCVLCFGALSFLPYQTIDTSTAVCVMVARLPDCTLPVKSVY